MISFHFDDGRYYRAPEHTSLTLYDCIYYCTAQPWAGKPRFSTHFILFYVVSGEMRLFADEEAYTVEAGSFFLLDANRRYRISCERQLSMYRVAFDCSPPQFLQQVTLPSAFPASSALFHRLVHLYHEFQMKRAVERCEFVLLEILMGFLDPSARMGSSERLFRRFCRYCDESFAEPLDAETVSAALGCHKDHLNRVVRRFCGKTFREYVTDLRLDAAKTLLLETDLSYAQIAESLGFSTVELFLKFFRYHTGTTPKRFRA